MKPQASPSFFLNSLTTPFLQPLFPGRGCAGRLLCQPWTHLSKQSQGSGEPRADKQGLTALYFPAGWGLAGLTRDCLGTPHSAVPGDCLTCRGTSHLFSLPSPVQSFCFLFNTSNRKAPCLMWQETCRAWGCTLSRNSHIGAHKNADYGPPPQTHCFRITEMGWSGRSQGEDSPRNSYVPYKI